MAKNTDWDRVSTEIHEIAYARKIARIILEPESFADISLDRVLRLAKSYLKVTKGYTKK